MSLEILFFLAGVLIIVAASLGCQIYAVVFKGFAPFVRTRNEVIKKILEKLEIKDGDHVYELGCGNAPFLKGVEEKNKNVELIGVEYDWLYYLKAAIQNSFSKRKVKLIHDDLFRVSIADADIIYLYLSEKMMRRIGDKLKKETKPGTRIVSYCYEIPNWIPEDSLKFDKQGDTVYFYTVL